jgi:hypothetical protein
VPKGPGKAKGGDGRDKAPQDDPARPERPEGVPTRSDEPA